ncbi:MAG: 23S rRNA (guanosine(2251)-2'-O)-methyltransferase RlmB [Ferruginibacter sp.]
MKKFRNPQQRPKKSQLIIGKSAVLKALLEGAQMERIYIQNTLHGPDVEEIKKHALIQLVPVNKVPVEKLNGFNVTNHEGCIAQLSKIHYQQLQDVISLAVENGETPLLLMLDGVTDIRNIGAITRSAYAMGVHAIIIPDKGVGALNEDAIFTSAGALEKIAVCRVNSLMKAVDEMHLNGIRVFASEMTAKTMMSNCNFSEPCCIVMGGEEKGVYPALMKICDEQFYIPMPGNFESLNVSVATGMILYEAIRQRLNAKY